MNNPRTPAQLAERRTAVSRAQPPAAHTFVEGEELFLASLPVIDDVTGQVCRRHRLSAAEADDFRSEVRLHFIDRDYEVLRRFEQRSTLATYVSVVIQRLFLDYRNRLWGKWRPSAEAKRLGPTAILIERLVARDGWSVDQVMETLRINHGVTIDASLQPLCDRLARRPPRRQVVGEDQAEALESREPAPDANVVRAEQGFLAKRVRAALDRARQALAPEDHLILKMRFEEAVPVADIARALHLNQKRLYRTIEHLLADIGDRLEAEGISREEVRALFADGSVDWNDDGESGGAPVVTEGPWRRRR